MATAPPSLQDDPLAEEVRVAMALNGGVSLAVWMGGSAAELDCARRAHLAPEEVRGAHPRRVYHVLCKAFRRVLVIDLMSGSSAGGINGALLGASICHRRRLNPNFLRDKWLQLGDFAELLHRTSEPSPGALMRGDLFYESLESAFQQLIDGEEETTLPADQEELSALDVSLDVTTTNVAGEPREFMDYWERPLTAREYRARFRFRTPVDYVPDMLASAARASASFPGAFEPWRIEAPAGDLAGFTRSRWVVDGGLLDNAPIGAVLELIPSRVFRRQVRRYVCYMNAEPPGVEEEQAASLDSPVLAAVGGYVINLPRKATFVDQLTAIERATRASTLGKRRTPAFDLLSLDLDTLTRTAESLLPSYRQGRHLMSLEELFTDPARARQAHESLSKQLDLPWIPKSLDPTRDGAWQWGLRPAERVIHLLLEIVRRAAASAAPDGRERLYTASGALHNHLQGIEDMTACFGRNDPGYGPVKDALDRAREQIASFDPLPVLRRAAAQLHSIRNDLVVEDLQAATKLFGNDWNSGTLTDAAFLHFLRRVLAIEVVRRSIAPDSEPFELGQDLRFAQLTPYAPGLVFTKRPILRKSEGWSTPAEKLTGLGLSHFAAFYRRSWRVNDFMWGRLDAAVRIVDLLVAPGRANQLRRDNPTGPEVAAALAEELLACEPIEEGHWLIEEALSAAIGESSAGPDGEQASSEPLLARLERAISADLATDDPGRPDAARPGDLTRTLFARAAQLEILAHELPVLNEESRRDVFLGAGAPSLRLPLRQGLRSAIEDLRGGEPLPKRLTAPDEITSTLAIRTSAHAALVTLGVLRAARMPLSRALFALRAGLLPIAGTVARRWFTRLGAVAAFYAATLFLAARLLTTKTKGFEKLTTITLTAELVALLMVFVVFGTAFVPLLRAAFSTSWRRRVVQGVWAFSLLASGGLAAFLVTGFAGGVSVGRLITAPHADRPPDWVLALVVAFVLGGPLVTAPAIVRGWVNKIFVRVWAGVISLMFAFGIAGLVIGYSIEHVAHGLHGSWWRIVIAVTALFVAPVLVFLSLLGRQAFLSLRALPRR